MDYERDRKIKNNLITEGKDIPRQNDKVAIDKKFRFKSKKKGVTIQIIVNTEIENSYLCIPFSTK